jgi:hypothetical protein
MTIDETFADTSSEPCVTKKATVPIPRIATAAIITFFISPLSYN